MYHLHGTTFGRELMGLRLREADRLLRAPYGKNSLPLPISEVAYICGFSSQSHFSARYKEHFGFTPNERRLNPSQDTTDMPV
ncbi:helix-turn-helix transcriptional regulator (plasmid) [Rhizobium leguminosarum bv. viciae]|nr:helix-turn-helix transcriptional regulator [Rhizobium leguminosarum bv. viciae]